MSLEIGDKVRVRDGRARIQSGLVLVNRFKCDADVYIYYKGAKNMNPEGPTNAANLIKFMYNWYM